MLIYFSFLVNFEHSFVSSMLITPPWMTGPMAVGPKT